MSEDFKLLLQHNMSTIFPILFNLSAFVALSIMHSFWFLGGKTGLKYAFPNNSKHKKKRHGPAKVVLLLYILLFITMSLFCIAQTDILSGIFNKETIIWGNRITGIIFMARALGSFKYVGFTKTFRGSEFAKLDTFMISPLCLAVAICSYFSTTNV